MYASEALQLRPGRQEQLILRRARHHVMEVPTTHWQLADNSSLLLPWLGGDGLVVRTHYYHVGSRELRSPSIQLLNKFRRGRNDAGLLRVQLSSLHGLAFFYQLFATTPSYRSRGLVAIRAAIARAIAGSIPRLSAFGFRLSAFGFR